MNLLFNFTYSYITLEVCRVYIATYVPTVTKRKKLTKCWLIRAPVAGNATVHFIRLLQV